MKITKITLSLLVGIGTGCTTVPTAPVVSSSDLPNCFDSNYDKGRGLFTIRNDPGKAVNQQCLLTVLPSSHGASAEELTTGNYTAYLVDGGGGGAGGTLQAFIGGGGSGGGGGGGGAGALEKRATVNLTEGVYKLTIGAGGLGGTACVARPNREGVAGGPGGPGSPSSMVRVATGESVVGTTGAEAYVRPTRARIEHMATKLDGHGGSGPGQTTGGHGGGPATAEHAKVQATPGASKLASGGFGEGGTPGTVSLADKTPGLGGGGGATSMGQGGGGGGESPGQKDIAPERGSLGSGGGGGEGSTSECDAGARGGHGYIALRPI